MLATEAAVHSRSLIAELPAFDKVAAAPVKCAGIEGIPAHQFIIAGAVSGTLIFGPGAGLVATG
jgi:hypothetical protein